MKDYWLTIKSVWVGRDSPDSAYYSNMWRDTQISLIQCILLDLCLRPYSYLLLIGKILSLLWVLVLPTIRLCASVKIARFFWILVKSINLGWLRVNLFLNNYLFITTPLFINHSVCCLTEASSKNAIFLFILLPQRTKGQFIFYHETKALVFSYLDKY